MTRSTLNGLWRDTTLGAIGRYLNGRGFKKSEWSDTGRMIVRIQDLTGTGTSPNYFDGECDEKHVVREGDLLISWAATLDAFIWHGPEAVLNQHIYKVESAIDRRFHFHLVKHLLEDIRRRAHGSGMVHVTKGAFERTPVRIPESRELQGAIADAIEQQLTRLDVASLTLARAQRRLRDMRHAILLAATTGSLSASHEARSSWATQSLADVTDPARPICYGILKPRTQEPGTVPYVEVRDLRHPVLRADDLNRTTEELHRAFSRSTLRAGDVLVAIRGSYERIGLVPPELEGANISRDVARVSPRSDVDPRYLMIWLRSPAVQRYFKGVARGVAVKGVNIGDLRQTRVDIPPLDVQKSIVTETEMLLSVVDELEVEVNRSLVRARALRREILAAAFSGELSRTAILE